ncbi:hypothetical protein LOK74_19135 [Brevibacillus humidisoli]|uniref:hypothetical protein n=1 Tax=Brevibacillus humidisoli TaxID=2895522 RepID=UPI001E512D9C|nr:hypothetical protein [Brevibacillus humidisoli]UFJ40129.1 hypothetical protein LOK74_19135 [Brevibacillus humidisoli]
MKNKKLVLSVLSTAVVSSIASSAYAAPSGGFYIGGEVDKYYTISAFVNDSTTATGEIVDASFDNVVYVHEDGQAASLKEIVDQQSLFDALRQATENDFEGIYTDAVTGEDVDPISQLDPVDPGELTVESVSAINATQVEVVFSVEVDKTTAEDLTTLPGDTTSSYTVDGTKLDTTNVTAELQDDKKTVILTFNTSQDGTSQTFEIAGVKSADKSQTLAKSTHVVSFDDTVAPEVTEATIKSNGDLEITFSEPLDAVDPIVRVNGNPVTVQAVGAGDTTVTVLQADLPTLTKGSTATLYVAGAKDVAGNEMALYNGSFEVPDDAVAPEIDSIEQIAQNAIRVQFSEPLGGTELEDGDIKVLIGSTVYYDGDAYATATTVNKNTTVDPTGKTYDVEFDLGGEGPNEYGIYPNSTASSATVTLLIDADAVEDATGNGIEAVSQSFTFTRDAEGPAFDSAEVSSNKQAIEVTFDEMIKDGADVDETKIIVTNEDGVRFSLVAAETDRKGAAGGDEKVLVLDFVTGGTEMTNGTYTLQFKEGAVVDSLGNKNAAFTTEVTVGDSTDNEKPTVALDGASSENVFVVDFGEKVTASALDLSNYKLDGQSLPDGTDIYFNSSSKDMVTIELPEGSVNIGTVGLGTDAVLTVANVADEAGNVADTTNLTVTISDNTAAELQSAELVGDILVLTFNEDLDAAFTAADLSAVLAEMDIEAGSTALEDGATDAVSSDVENNKLILTITGGDSNWDTIKAADTVTVTTKAGTLTDANGYGVAEGVEVTVQ